MARIFKTTIGLLAIGLVMATNVASQAPSQVATPLGSDLVIGKAGEFGHTGSVGMLFGDGAGGFTMNTVGMGTFTGYEVAVGDVNNDDKDDVVAVSSTGPVFVALGNFMDGFQHSDLTPVGAFVEGPGNCCDRTRVLKLGDINNDGNLDIAVTMWAKMAVMLGNGNGTFGSPILTNSTGFDARGMALGDLDGDGNLDLVANHAVGNWWLAFHKGNGNGTFQSGVVIANSQLAIPNVFLGDADGDGDLDIYTGALNGRLKIFTNNGAPNFTLTDIEPGSGLQGGLLVVDDLNGDGTPDAVAGTEANNFTNARIWLSNGSGGFTAANYAPVGSQPRHGVVADVDEDGIKDIAMVTVNTFGGNPGSLWILQGSGNGSFAAPYSVATYRNNFTIAAGNFDAPAECDPGSYLSGGTCTLAPAGSYSAGGTATSPTPCAAGTYSDTAGASACTPAPAGSYVPGPGATAPTSCPAGQSSNVGATACFVVDSDGDGVGDTVDAYPNSNLGGMVAVGTCNSGVANQLLPNGATFNDLMATAVSGAANHGALVSAVSNLSNGWKSTGLISGRDHGAIVSCVAKSK
jgi:hypothetical protein